MTINGIPVNDQYSSSSVINLLFEEFSKAQALHGFGFPAKTVSKLLSMPSPSGDGQGSFRIDVRELRDNTLPVNDFHRDGMYQSGMWARSVQDLLKGHGEIRFIAQPLYTVTLVVDPVKPMSIYMLGALLRRMIGNGAPVQINFVIVPDLASVNVKSNPKPKRFVLLIF
jgi:hypothetical protein